MQKSHWSSYFPFGLNHPLLFLWQGIIASFARNLYHLGALVIQRLITMWAGMSVACLFQGNGNHVAVCLQTWRRTHHPCLLNDSYQRTVSSWLGEEETRREPPKTSCSEDPSQTKCCTHFVNLSLWCCLMSLLGKRGQCSSLVSFLFLGLKGMEIRLHLVRPVKPKTLLAMKTWKLPICCRNDLSMLCLLNGMLNTFHC